MHRELHVHLGAIVVALFGLSAVVMFLNFMVISSLLLRALRINGFSVRSFLSDFWFEMC